MFRKRAKGLERVEPVDPFDRRGYLRSPVTYGTAPPNKGRKFPPEVLTPAELCALMTAAYTHSRGCGLRNQALLAIGARAGLRCAEVLALYPKDVDLEHGRIQVLHGKGNKRRVVALDPGACALVRRWTDQRRELGFDGSQPLFCVMVGPTRGLALNAPYVSEQIKSWARYAGIEKRVHFHGLRHSYASYLLDSGVPIHFIKRMLGHSSIAITEHYADHISPSRVIELLHALEWPSLHAAALQSSQSESTA